MRAPTIRWQGEDLLLLPERAVWWPRHRTLLVADVHLGKDQVFRRHGIGLPRGPTLADLAGLDALLARTAARRLVVLGDLVHAPPTPGDDWPTLIEAWREHHAGREVALVVGNHDRRLRPWLARWRIAAHDRLHLPPFDLVHDPAGAGPGATLAGHLHPVVKLRESRRGSLRLPVFWFRGALGVLPAFGAFTGGQVIRPGPADRVYLVAGGRVMGAAEDSAGAPDEPADRESDVH